MYGFKEIGGNQFECNNCKMVVPSGIFNISGHWADCEGKEFTKALIDKRTTSGKLTLNDVDELQKTI